MIITAISLQTRRYYTVQRAGFTCSFFLFFRYHFHFLFHPLISFFRLIFHNLQHLVHQVIRHNVGFHFVARRTAALQVAVIICPALGYRNNVVYRVHIGRHELAADAAAAFIPDVDVQFFLICELPSRCLCLFFCFPVSFLLLFFFFFLSLNFLEVFQFFRASLYVFIRLLLRQQCGFRFVVCYLDGVSVQVHDCVLRVRFAQDICFHIHFSPFFFAYCCCIFCFIFFVFSVLFLFLLYYF